MTEDNLPPSPTKSHIDLVTSVFCCYLWTEVHPAVSLCAFLQRVIFFGTLAGEFAPTIALIDRLNGALKMTRRSRLLDLLLLPAAIPPLVPQISAHHNTRRSLLAGADRHAMIQQMANQVQAGAYVSSKKMILVNGERCEASSPISAEAIDRPTLTLRNQKRCTPTIRRKHHGAYL